MKLGLFTPVFGKLDVKQMLSLLRLEPCTCRLDGQEALNDYPVSLHRRSRRNNRLIEIARERGEDVVHLLLPAYKLISTIGHDVGMCNERDCGCTHLW